VKPPAVFQSDEEGDTDFESDSDYVESDQASEKEKTSGKYAFLQNHPLHETHQVSISKSKNLVPNFAGGSLPRCDKGDREYYCATMLTLFKPWRHGKNLKDDDQSWDEAFTDYKFTPHQIELMKFFNIRYECNDARDDYSKLLKQKNASDGVFPHWFRADDHDNFDGNYDDGSDLWFMKSMKQINTPPLAKGSTKNGANGRNPEIVTSAGWLDQCQDGPHQWSLQKLKLKNYHLHNGMLLFRKNVNRSWLKETNHFLHNLKTNLARIQIRMMFEL